MKLPFDQTLKKQSKGLVSLDNLTAYPVLKLNDTELKIGEATNTSKTIKPQQTQTTI